MNEYGRGYSGLTPLKDLTFQVFPNPRCYPRFLRENWKVEQKPKFKAAGDMINAWSPLAVCPDERQVIKRNSRGIQMREGGDVRSASRPDQPEKTLAKLVSDNAPRKGNERRKIRMCLWVEKLFVYQLVNLITTLQRPIGGEL